MQAQGARPSRSLWQGSSGLASGSWTDCACSAASTRHRAPAFFAQYLCRGSQDAGVVRAAGAALAAPRHIHARLLEDGIQERHERCVNMRTADKCHGMARRCCLRPLCRHRGQAWRSAAPAPAPPTLMFIMGYVSRVAPVLASADSRKTSAAEGRALLRLRAGTGAARGPGWCQSPQQSGTSSSGQPAPGAPPGAFLQPPQRQWFSCLRRAVHHT